MTEMKNESAGLGLAVVAVALFAAYDNGVKLISATTAVALVLWTRYLLQMLWIVARRRRLASQGAFRTHRLRLHVARAFVLLACNVTAFFSFKYLPMATVTSIAMLTPLLLTALAALAFREPVDARQWVWVVAGLCGALMITKPGAEGFQAVLLLPVAFLVAYTAFQAITSRLTRTDTPDTVLVYTSTIGFAVLSALLLFTWSGLPSPAACGILALSALCSALGHHLLVMAYQGTPASGITPFLYLQLPFAALGGFVLFAEVPDAWAAAGGGVIVASGILSALQTRRPSRARAVSIGSAGAERSATATPRASA